MNQKLRMTAMIACLLLPAALARADEEKKETAAGEKTESVEKQRHEEREALGRYNRAAAKFGKDSEQAKKAWRRYAHEMKEHGHESEIQNPTAVGTPAATK